jgi:predicted nucleic acid-binding Zn ribbon protein
MERIGHEVDRTLRRSGSRDVLPLTRVVGIWPEVVGDAIARQAWPLRTSRDGTLHVATSSATWANELTLLGDEILERLRVRLGPDTPSSLRCAVGPIPEPDAEQTPSSPATPASDASPEASKTATAVASAIDDPELRALVARAARASLSRAASDRHF